MGFSGDAKKEIRFPSEQNTVTLEMSIIKFIDNYTKKYSYIQNNSVDSKNRKVCVQNFNKIKKIIE